MYVSFMNSIERLYNLMLFFFSKYKVPASSSIRGLRKRSLSLVSREDTPNNTERSVKRNRHTEQDSEFPSDAETDVSSVHPLSQVTSQTITKNIREKGLDYYYNAGKKASEKSIWSPGKIAQTKHIERSFFEFQRIRLKPQAWPEDGLPIDDCTAFMQILAESGKGLLDRKITRTYFLKLVRIFGELVRFALFYVRFIRCSFGE
jgi:hypothetical protein